MVHAGQSLADGRYLLVRKVAEGGTAIVHLGFDTWTEQWRAVKTLLPEYAKRAALRHRFEREAATMKGLSHENVVAVYDAGVDGDIAFMVMEYAEAGSIIDWIERYGPMPPRMASEITLQLCEGIQAAHQHGIIHRDVKPQNLLVDRYGRCKVTDFGIAQVRQDTRMTMTGTVMGTIGYMAPEQHESAKHADERADVYSIAATFYTLLKGEAATHLFMAEASDFEGIVAPLAEIIKRGAEYRREQRYDDVPELAEAVQGALRILPPDPLDTPPLVATDTPLLDDITPPSFHTTRSPDVNAGGYVPVGAVAVAPAPTRVAPPENAPPPAPSAPEPYPSPQGLYALEDLYPPEALQDEAPENQMVLADHPVNVHMPGPTATPTLPTRDDLTSDQNRPTPKPLQRFERPRQQDSEYTPWIAVGLFVAAFLGIGFNMVYNLSAMNQYSRNRDSAITTMEAEFKTAIASRIYKQRPRLDREDPSGWAEAKLLIDKYKQHVPRSTDRIDTARRVHQVLANQVQTVICTRAHQQGQVKLKSLCRELSDINGGLEEVLDQYDHADQDLAEFRSAHPSAGCIYGND